MQILEYILANYTWFLIGIVLILLAIIGYHADKTNFGQGKKENSKEDKPDKNENLVDEEKIVIATNKFKPDNILVGQGFIAAQSRTQAIDWLKIIKTALIFVEDSEEE